ncbi:HsdR family type I site-specific deoxyribonuclease [Arthrobacter sp. JZ12]|uniref:type I restriction endonuclease subunit R n=1 Tax=Arthrobacter sp. JZ12 TaxID=2654190 RepID=UPI002B47AE06|nr:HsdR family type I site-specific deoxyribonuclease [Arthrobacter sp. JZ12]WRH25365.1 HsdR family type I site-specific deoxyribonuclease [Arthrobacter sp. JZ12]
MSSGAEYDEVEKPLLDQLANLKYTTIVGHKYDPSVTERSSFREVLLEGRLRKSLRELNRRDGDPWLDHSRISEAVSALSRPGAGKLLEINERMTNLLLEGVTVAGMPGWDQGRNQRIHFVDWDRPERNDFLAISQFRVDEPGGQSSKFIAPDVVLFVNGIPLVVIECKNPHIVDPMAEGIEQLRRYANQRDLGIPEGNETLFWTNQFIISTHGDRARVGTITSTPEHFLEWKDAAPLTRDELADKLGKSKDQLSGQELLAAGMLTKANLLDIARHYVLFTGSDGRRVKIVARYQQYRAVGRALNRLRTGKTRLQHGEHDQRGGLIWHTQGSGKSLTMVFLVRAMRSDPALRTYKVVIVTDRTDLEKQLSQTARLSGEIVERARKSSKLRALLSEQGPAVVFAMIQKYRDIDDTSRDGGLAEDDGSEAFGELNSDESIVILVDEAHRSQSSTLHANLMAALPNAAKIGFTGTPIMKEGKKKTESIFGTRIDHYTIREAETDGAVLPVLYEGRTVKGAVKAGSDLDELFEDMFAERTPEELHKIKTRYATAGVVVEAPLLIRDKARSMMWHYISTVMPNGFKAQVAASSRLAAVRYREALMAARDEIVEQIDSLDQNGIASSANGDTDLNSFDRKTQVLLRARRHIELLKLLEFVPVMSGHHNDDPSWAAWTHKSNQEVAIADFKKALGPVSERSSPVAFLIVRTMLLTGFDAPIEQVLYLDRSIQDAELLQAIARVNRTASGKHAGFFVDYYGVGGHLQKALAAYAPEDAADTTGAVTSILDELPKLRDRHARTVAVFATAGIETFGRAEDIEACVVELADQSLRAKFSVLLRSFLTTLDVVLPRPEALPYVHDAKRLGLIQMVARRRYRDDNGNFDASLYGAKVRELVDEHVTALDIAVKVPPVSITAPDFIAKVKGLTSDNAQASEMEHALRYHIQRNFDLDPARYAKLSERLDEILRNLSGKWDQLALALEQFTREAADTESISHDGDPLVARFLGVLETEFALNEKSAEGHRESLLDVAQAVVGVVVERSLIVRFWQNLHAQDDLRAELIHILDEWDVLPFGQLPSVADKLVALAKANQPLIASRRPGGGT